MPSPSDFKRAFHLTEGSTIGTGTHKLHIDDSKVGHETIQEHENYEFPTTLHISFQTKTLSQHALLSQLNDALTTDTKIVYSAYGSPYSCQIHKIKVQSIDTDEHTAIIHLQGKAIRNRDIPTLAEQKEKERKAHHVIEPSKDEFLEQYGDEYKALKSRFATSHCALCGGQIDPGVLIAKRKDDDTRGGWSHASCIMKNSHGNNEEEEEE